MQFFPHLQAFEVQFVWDLQALLPIFLICLFAFAGIESAQQRLDAFTGSGWAITATGNKGEKKLFPNLYVISWYMCEDILG